MAKGQCRQFVRWYHLKQLAREPHDYSELAGKMGISNNVLSDVISRMRSKGHSIWTINDGKGYFVHYRGGPDMPVNVELTIEQIISNDWYDTKELSDLLELSVNEVTRRITRISNRVNVDKRQSNKKHRGRFLQQYKINFTCG